MHRTPRCTWRLDYLTYDSGMAKQTKKGMRVKKKAGARAARAAPPVVQRIGLDAGALAYRALLSDPCNAPLVGPAYSGPTTGNYRRFRKIVYINGDEVERYTAFNFKWNSMFHGGHSAGGAGGVVTLQRADIFNSGSLGGAHGDIRCLAACVKVRYIGPESSRAGTVGLHTGEHIAKNDASGTGITIGTMLQQCPHIARLGEVAHEVKWLPSAEDEDTGNPQGSAYGRQYDGSNATVVLSHVPAGTVMMEVTAVYELENQGGDFVSTYIQPSTGNTLSQVLRSLGPVATWAYNNYALPVMKSAVTNVARTVISGMSAVGPMVPLVSL